MIAVLHFPLGWDARGVRDDQLAVGGCASFILQPCRVHHERRRYMPEAFSACFPYNSGTAVITHAIPDGNKGCNCLLSDPSNN